MENMLVIVLLVIGVISVLYFLLKGRNSYNVKKDITKDNTMEQNVSNMQAPQKKKNSYSTTKKGGIFDQTPNPIIRDKAISWTTSTSYEEDIKEINLERIGEEKVVNNVINFNNEIEKTDFKILILLVDDSLVVRKYVGDLLKKNNYDVILKNDGWEAITYLNSSIQKPELIITDIEMPNMNGFQLIEAVRKEKKYDNVPILVISAHAENHLKLMEDENVSGFIKKPFEDQDLLLQLIYLLQN